MNTRRTQYEEALSNTPYNYDVWFDYLRMLEQEGQKDKVIDAYERAIKNVPPSKEKRFWRRYIYLWIYYAVYLECDLGDVDRRARRLSALSAMHSPQVVHFRQGRLRRGLRDRFGSCTRSWSCGRTTSIRHGSCWDSRSVGVRSVTCSCSTSTWSTV